MRWAHPLVPHHGALATLRLNGQRIRESFAFDPNRLQTTAIGMVQCADNTPACASPQLLLNLGYAYTNGTGPAGGPNNSGNPRAQTIQTPGLALTQTYTDDGWDRLTGMQETGGSANLNESYCYDAFGNRAVLSRPTLSPLIPQVSACNPNDVALLFPLNRWSGRTYDAAGAMAFDGRSNLRMDAEARLRQSFDNVSPGTVTNYEYDGESPRVAKDTVGVGRTVFVYDAFGNLAAEYGGSNDLVGTPPFFLHTDTLGSTRLTTDLNGNVVRRTDYWPFGQEINGLTQDAPYRTSGMGYNPGLRNPPTLFTGKERDAETGLDYFGARYISSAQGRFTSADLPFADQRPQDPQSWNLYSYVRNNPLKFIDPNGRNACGTNDDSTCVVKVTLADRTKNEQGQYNDSFAAADPAIKYQSDFNALATVSVNDVAIESFLAKTKPSNSDKYATVENGTYSGTRVDHHGTPAIALNSDGNVPIITEKNPNTGASGTANGIRVHTAGVRKFTGEFPVKDAKGNVVRTGGVSEGCQLVCTSQYTRFLQITGLKPGDLSQPQKAFTVVIDTTANKKKK